MSGTFSIEELDAKGIEDALKSRSCARLTADILKLTIHKMRESKYRRDLSNKAFGTWEQWEQDPSFQTEFAKAIKQAQQEIDGPGIKAYLKKHSPTEPSLTAELLQAAIDRIRAMVWEQAQLPAEDQTMASTQAHDTSAVSLHFGKWKLDTEHLSDGKTLAEHVSLTFHDELTEQNVSASIASSKPQTPIVISAVNATGTNPDENASATISNANSAAPANSAIQNQAQNKNTGVSFIFPNKPGPQPTPVPPAQFTFPNQTGPGPGPTPVPPTQFTFPNSGTGPTPQVQFTFPQPFSISDESDAYKVRIITWARAHYGLKDKNVWYPLTFARSRTSQTDSHEYMRFLEEFFKEFNTSDRPKTPSVLDNAIKALETEKIDYFSGESLKKVLLENGRGDEIGDRGEAKLFNYVRNIRLKQNSRNSSPYGPEAEDSPYFSQRMNSLGTGDIPRHEMLAALKNARMFWGMTCERDPHHPENYTINKDGKALIKVTVPDKGGNVSFALQAGVGDKDEAITKLVFMVGTHVQQTGCNLFRVKLGGDIYENVRMLQLALYDWNLNIQFKPPEDPSQKLLQQINDLETNLKGDPVEAKKHNIQALRDEVNFLIENAQTFDVNIARHSSIAVCKPLINGRDQNGYPLPVLHDGKPIYSNSKLTKEYLLERSRNQTIFPTKTPPTPGNIATPASGP